jgi:hypothetical protein
LTAFRTAPAAVHRIPLAQPRPAADTAFIDEEGADMNTAATRLTHAVMIVAALAAIVIVAPLQAAPVQAPAVVTLPMVTVTAKRANFAPAQVVQMPKVTVTGRRLDRNDTLQARRDESRPARIAACTEPATVRC